jgi:putative oxidoreductase
MDGSSMYVRLRDRVRALAGKLAFIGPTLARLTVGVVFLQTGWGKLHDLEKVTNFFTTLHIPAPGFQATLVASTEFIGGILVLAGLGTRFAAAPLAFTMVVAILTAKRGDIEGIGDLVGFEEFSYLVMFLWLTVAGAGPLSLDNLIDRLLARRRAAAGAGGASAGSS